MYRLRFKKFLDIQEIDTVKVLVLDVGEKTEKKGNVSSVGLDAVLR